MQGGGRSSEQKAARNCSLLKSPPLWKLILVFVYDVHVYFASFISLQQEGDCVNVDVTSPGATLALGMLFFRTGNRSSCISSLDKKQGLTRPLAAAVTVLWQLAFLG